MATIRKPLTTTQIIILIILAVLGAFSLGYIALQRGEAINAMWIVVAAVCVYLVAYRIYGIFISSVVLKADSTRMTPAYRRNDGLDYVPTDEKILFGHHFAAIAGAGPLVGPVLAAQMGYLPGLLWILAGCVLAGAVQDFMVLFISTRRDGRSLGELVREEMGDVAGVIALIACFMIMIIILGVLAMVVVKALAGSPWGTYTVAFTIPLAFFMGIYLRFIRPGRIGEVSVIGLVLLLFGIVSGGWIKDSSYASWFNYEATTLTLMIIIYGFIAAVLPVWLLLAPRDYLSTFLKIGTIVALAIGIVVVRPMLEMPALTKYVDGSGPVWGGNLFPFLFITIACGAVSGFHALISSGTTPKMLANEDQACFIGYGGMLMESFVAIMALIAASVINPGVYFSMNAPLSVLLPSGTGDLVQSAATVVSGWGFQVTPEMLTNIANEVGEKSIIAKTGGAPTLAVGMAHILHNALGGWMGMSFWYHFAILFEALFILTAVDAGTRSARFMLQDLLGIVVPHMRKTDNLFANLVATALVVLMWGYFVYQGAVDPKGGIYSLWPLFGIANQMLAAVALLLCAVVLFKMKQQRYAWVAIVPAAWLFICTMTAGWQKVFDAKLSFFVAAGKAANKQLAVGNYINGILTALFMVVVVTLTLFTIRSALKSLKSDKPTVHETPYEPFPSEPIKVR
ncbi:MULTISPECIES: carbon starvation CstA family protein [Bartonella]|uniref:carbon starvation CstA family protein n=1 Tax=Bartonella TaxID=773 RepID=UPI0018DCAF50|nr:MULTISPECIES: carbon starvation CstA family protein [Bartonella]MBH9994359.1 carbon starvation protein A [Bartonella sp. P0291]MBH9997296.1 carbon starvation protein A [Bartonella sp. M0192]MBH9999456.1 carbon starvation protein A [Bartonella sp. M0191]MBI0007060.1 carbon starvation protein A [Bartonella sp. M0193]MBI0010747.1 carbon starvation protein A [Bartonella sp. M0176]